MYRFAAAGLGGALLGLGADRRTRAVLRVLGLGLVAFALQPLFASGLLRAGDKRRRVSFKSVVDVARPVGEVFAFFKNFENFARVMRGIRSVIDYEDGRSHWEVYTPSGGTIAWDAVVTKYVPNNVIAWTSVPRSPVDDGTRSIHAPCRGLDAIGDRVHLSPGSHRFERRRALVARPTPRPPLAY